MVVTDGDPARTAFTAVGYKNRQVKSCQINCSGETGGAASDHEAIEWL